MAMYLYLTTLPSGDCRSGSKSDANDGHAFLCRRLSASLGHQRKGRPRTGQKTHLRPGQNPVPWVFFCRLSSLQPLMNGKFNTTRYPRVSWDATWSVSVDASNLPCDPGTHAVET